MRAIHMTQTAIDAVAKAGFSEKAMSALVNGQPFTRAELLAAFVESRELDVTVRRNPKGRCRPYEVVRDDFALRIIKSAGFGESLHLHRGTMSHFYDAKLVEAVLQTAREMAEFRLALQAAAEQPLAQAA